jgi:serine/threonine protein kinase
LGDFGNAFDATDMWYINNSRLTRDMGTPLWSAPEQHEDSPAAYTVTSATNVYQIGLPILQTMHLQTPGSEVHFSDTRRYEVFPGTAPYPQELLDLVWSCVALNPTNRPSAKDLYRSVRVMAMGFMDYEGDGSHRIPWRKWNLDGHTD